VGNFHVSARPTLKVTRFPVNSVRKLQLRVSTRRCTPYTGRKNVLTGRIQCKKLRCKNTDDAAFGDKFEAFVLPNGLCIGATNHHPGKTSELTIFKKHISWYQHQIEKLPAVNDNGIFGAVYDRHWAVLGDKIYQGTVGLARLIHAKKNSNWYMKYLGDCRYTLYHPIVYACK